jgi:hypothetical protein
MPVALSAAIQCLFHDAISFAMTLSAAIQHLFLYANSFAMPVALSAAMERSVRFHSLCLLPSRRQSLYGFHNATSFALPVAFSAALQRWSHNAIIGYACCLFCGNSCLSHDAISFARTRSASIQRLLPLSAAVQRLLLYAIFTRHACCPLGSIGALDAISFAALSAKILCGFAGLCFSCTASRGQFLAGQLCLAPSLSRPPTLAPQRF